MDFNKYVIFLAVFPFFPLHGGFSFQHGTRHKFPAIFL